MAAVSPFAYLIDPFKRSVERVPYDGRLETAYRLLDCGIVEAVVFDRTLNRDVVYVDEEGLLKGPQFFFSIPGRDPLAGKGLVVGTTEDGTTDCDPQSAIGDVWARVRFLVKIA